MLTCGPPSLSSATPKAKGEDGESCSEDDSSEDEENPTVSYTVILRYFTYQGPLLEVNKNLF